MKNPSPKVASHRKESSGNRPTNRKLVITLLVLVFLGIATLLFFTKGGSAKVRQIYYGSVVRQAYHKEYENLAPALEGLGLDENKNIRSTCENEKIATDGVNVNTVLFCGVQADKYIVVNDANKQSVLNAAKQLDELAKQFDGRMYTNTGPTFSKYFAEITSGVDYNPDFGVTFVRSNYLCEVHLNVAYSNPKPPAYSIQFGCNAPRVTTDDNYLLPPGA